VEIQGGGPLDSLVRERVAGLQRRNRPVEAGHFLAKAEAEAAIVRADWVLIPSRIESIPVVFSDAMKLGRPVISTPVGDLPRLLVEHSVGVCSHDVAAGAFATAIRECMKLAAGAYVNGIADVATLFSLSGAITPRILSVMNSVGSLSGHDHE
jgi:glycosyltransferase involved in cell wall biosynthesis